MSNVFSMHNINAWMYKLLMDKICMIFINKLWDPKFVMLGQIT
jgi:hypothetical protein